MGFPVEEEVRIVLSIVAGEMTVAEAARRHEHDRPGALDHLDVRKIGRVPDGPARDGRGAVGPGAT